MALGGDPEKDCKGEQGDGRCVFGAAEGQLRYEGARAGQSNGASRAEEERESPDRPYRLSQFFRGFFRFGTRDSSHSATANAEPEDRNGKSDERCEGSQDSNSRRPQSKCHDLGPNDTEGK